ncbi:MAG: hypothetical protein V8S74_07845 [Lachnospirales bacterium]
MKIKSLLSLFMAFIMLIAVVPAYADTTVTKYENQVYKIGYDLPANAYIFVQKDRSKPAFVGVYDNQKGEKAEFVKNRKFIYGTEADYFYPRYFENNGYYSYLDDSLPPNQCSCSVGRYFEYSTYLNFTNYDRKRNKNVKYDFLYMENCYAIAMSDIYNINIDVTDEGYMPSDKVVTSGKTYKVSVNNDENMGYFACYKVIKYSNELKPLTKNFIINKSYQSTIKEGIYDNIMVTIPKDTDIIFKSGVNITDVYNPTYTVTSKGVTLSNNFVEPYNFADVSNSLKNYIKTEINALSYESSGPCSRRSVVGYNTDDKSAEDRRRVFKTLETIPKNDAEALYVRYVREIYVMYDYSPYIDIMIGKYLYNGSSFKDLDNLLRIIAHNEFRGYIYMA